MLLKDIHPMERYHMEKEGSTLSLKAPKHVIGFRKTDGKEIGLKPRDYDAYQRIKDESPEQLDRRFSVSVKTPQRLRKGS